MSAIRLRKTDKGVEVVVDDETPISDTPVMLLLRRDSVCLTIDEADALARGLLEAVKDAKAWLAMETWR